MDRIHKHQDCNDNRGKPIKRTLESEELGFNKKRRLDTELDNRSVKIVKSGVRRSSSFANDRLKKLRDRIRSEVVPFSTTISSSILVNDVSNIKRSTNTNSFHSSANSLVDKTMLQSNDIKSSIGNTQCNIQLSKVGQNHVHDQSSTKIEVTPKGVHHTKKPEDYIILNANNTPSKGEKTELSFIHNKCKLLSHKICNIECLNEDELPTSSSQKNLSEHSIHNKVDVSVSNDKEKNSEIIIKMRKSLPNDISSMNFCGRSVASHNNSLNISITNKCLETETPKVSTSPMSTAISNKVKKSYNVDNNLSSYSSSNQDDQDKNKSSPPSNSKNEVTASVSSSQERTLNRLNLLNSSKVNVKTSEDNTKCWTNYSKIIDSFYERLFSSDQEKKGTSSYSNNFCETGRSNKVEEQNATSDQDGIMEWDDDNVVDDTENINKSPTLNENHCSQQEMYIVVDTNVFVSDLGILKDIVACGSNGRTKCILYVPWMVLTELDFMKDDWKTSPHLKRNVTDAVVFINKTLQEGGRKLLGQNIYEVEQQKCIGKAPDDKIVSCCLQAKQNNLNVILLSNDINLKNKLLVNGIPAFSTTEMFSNPIITSSNGNSSHEDEVQKKYQEVNEKMSVCCSYIICECVTNAYGKVWNQMGLLKDPPPWTFNVCLQIFKKYWSVVFRGKLLKHCLRTVEQLDILLNVLESSKNADKFEEYVQKCLSLCVFLKDLEEHKDFVETTVDDINSVVNFR